MGLFAVINFVVHTAVSPTPAPNSGLIVFLPLMGAILGAVVGAFGGAWANSWYRNREALKARDEERDGLLILLSTEVSTNNQILGTSLKGLASTSDANRATVAATLRSEVWDKSNVRLAQLIPGNFLAALAFYYHRIEFMRLQWKVPSGESSEFDAERARDVWKNGISMIRASQDHMSNPAFVASLLNED